MFLCVDTPIFLMKFTIFLFWASFRFWGFLVCFCVFVFVKVVHFSYKHLHFFDKVVRFSYKVLRNPYKVVWNFCHFLCFTFAMVVFQLYIFSFAIVLFQLYYIVSSLKYIVRTIFRVMFLPHYTIRRCFTDDFNRKGNQMLSYMQ